FSIPSSASFSKSSSMARFSKACLSNGDISPERYFLKSPKDEVLICFLRFAISFFKTYLQVSFSILKIALYLFYFISQSIRYFLVTSLFQVKQGNAGFLLIIEFFHTF